MGISVEEYSERTLAVSKSIVSGIYRKNDGDELLKYIYSGTTCINVGDMYIFNDKDRSARYINEFMEYKKFIKYEIVNEQYNIAFINSTSCNIIARCLIKETMPWGEETLYSKIINFDFVIIKDDIKLAVMQLTNTADRKRKDEDRKYLIDINNSAYYEYAWDEVKGYSVKNKGSFIDDIIKPQDICIPASDEIYYDRHMTLSTVKAKILANQEYNFEYRLSSEEGISRWNLASFAKVADSTEYLTMSIKDITDRIMEKKNKDVDLKRESVKFNFLLKTMCEFFMEVDVAGETCSMSFPKEKFTARGEFKEIMGNFIDSTIESYEKKKFEEEFTIDNLIKKIKDNDGLYSTFTTIKNDYGLRYYIINNTRYVGKDNKDYIFIYAQDVTSLRQEEEDAQAKIRGLLKESERSNSLKTYVLTRMSHEIRTSLNSVVGITELAKDEDKKGYFRKIHESVNQIIDTINELAEAVSIDIGKAKLIKREFDIAEIVNGISTDYYSQAIERNFDFNIKLNDIDDKIYSGDLDKIRQAINLIINNAIVMTRNGGRIEVTIAKVEEDEEKATFIFNVKDNGVGLKEKVLKSIFSQFNMDSSGSVDSQNVAICFTICKEIVELMGGDIEVNSTYGVGTDVIVRLSLSKSSIHDNRADNLKQDDFESYEIDYDDDRLFKGVKVLLAEDNAINADIILSILEAKNIKVDVAGNGQLAYDLYSNKKDGYYNAVLMDIRMPNVDGLQATQMIRASEKKDAATIPIIALTANAFDGDYEDAMKSGMNAYLLKPVDTKVMFKTLAKYAVKQY